MARIGVDADRHRLAGGSGSVRSVSLKFASIQLFSVCTRLITAVPGVDVLADLQAVGLADDAGGRRFHDACARGRAALSQAWRRPAAPPDACRLECRGCRRAPRRAETTACFGDVRPMPCACCRFSRALSRPDWATTPRFASACCRRNVVLREAQRLLRHLLGRRGLGVSGLQPLDVEARRGDGGLRLSRRPGRCESSRRKGDRPAATCWFSTTPTSTMRPATSGTIVTLSC